MDETAEATAKKVSMLKLFINGRFVVLSAGSLLSLIKNIYWGLGFSRLQSIFIQLGLNVFVKSSERINVIKKRIFILQKFVKKCYVYDRILKRDYSINIDFYVKNG